MYMKPVNKQIRRVISCHGAQMPNSDFWIVYQHKSKSGKGTVWKLGQVPNISLHFCDFWTSTGRSNTPKVNKKTIHYRLPDSWTSFTGHRNRNHACPAYAMNFRGPGEHSIEITVAISWSYNDRDMLRNYNVAQLPPGGCERYFPCPIQENNAEGLIPSAPLGFPLYRPLSFS